VICIGLWPKYRDMDRIVRKRYHYIPSKQFP
jgi:hypothetical protein